MSSFTKFNAELHVSYAKQASRELDDDYWVLTKSFTYYLDNDTAGRYVRVPAGFLSDATSVNFIVRSLIPRMGKHSQAAFLHDYLCETYYVCREVDGEEVKVNIDRKEVDRIFFEALKVSLFAKWRIFLVKMGVTAYRLVKRPTKPKVSSSKLRMEELYREVILPK